MHCHALPAARGCAVGRPRRRAAAHPPLRPPTLAYSPICPPRSSRSLEPPEEHGQHSRGSSRGWSPERRGCPRSRASRHPRRGGHPVAPHWSWPMLVVSWRLGAPANPFVPVWPNGCSAEVGSLTAACGETPSPSRRPGCGFAHLHPAEHRYKGIPAISAAHLQKKEAFQRGRWLQLYPLRP